MLMGSRDGTSRLVDRERGETRQREKPDISKHRCSLVDSPLAELLQDVEHLLRLLGEAVLAQLLQLSADTQTHTDGTLKSCNTSWNLT